MVKKILTMTDAPPSQKKENFAFTSSFLCSPQEMSELVWETPPEPDCGDCTSAETRHQNQKGSVCNPRNRVQVSWRIFTQFWSTQHFWLWFAALWWSEGMQNEIIPPCSEKLEAKTKNSKAYYINVYCLYFYDFTNMILLQFNLNCATQWHYGLWTPWRSSVTPAHFF